MRTWVCLLVLAFSGVLPAYAGSLVDLSVVDRDTGQTLQTYSRSGKLYIAGVPGHRYAVRMSNRTSGRIMAVLSVDGVNAVSGETASPHQSGYVLDAWQSAEITGWRKNLDEVAQFNFTALSDSYAARTGRADNVGVIGVAVFTERVREPVVTYQAPQPSSPPLSRFDTESRDKTADSYAQNEANEAVAQPAPPAASSAKSASGAAPTGLLGQRQNLAKAEEKLGTGHGAREIAHVGTTSFERASSSPVEQVSVYYDSYNNLVARGIIRRPPVRHDPEAFPANFVPDPPTR